MDSKQSKDCDISDYSPSMDLIHMYSIQAKIIRVLLTLMNTKIRELSDDIYKTYEREREREKEREKERRRQKGTNMYKCHMSHMVNNATTMKNAQVDNIKWFHLTLYDAFNEKI